MLNVVFLSTRDELIEMRRKQTLEMIKSKAEREGKSGRVYNYDGVLSIDEVAVFSLTRGILHNDDE